MKYKYSIHFALCRNPGKSYRTRHVLGFRYISHTQLIAETDAINFVFLFPTFCQLSRLTFISNRINEGVSGKPTNLNWPAHTHSYIWWNIFLKTHRLKVLNWMRFWKLFALFWFSVNPLFWRCAGNNWPVLFWGCFHFAPQLISDMSA